MPVSGFARYRAPTPSDGLDLELDGGGAVNQRDRDDGEQYDPLLDEMPETAIGEGVDIRGELQFDRMLRVDGSFEGKLNSTGSVVVGRKGCLMADVKGMDALVIDGGKVIGDVQVDRLVLRGTAFLQGNFSCKSLSVGMHCAITGRSNTHALAPEIIDAEGGVIMLEQGLSVEHYYAAKRERARADAAKLYAARQKVPSSAMGGVRGAPKGSQQPQYSSGLGTLSPRPTPIEPTGKRAVEGEEGGESKADDAAAPETAPEPGPVMASPEAEAEAEVVAEAKAAAADGEEEAKGEEAPVPLADS